MKKQAFQNPFVVGKYISDEYFCDRKKETDFLIRQIRNGRNTALISLRRMGKTGLIQHTILLQGRFTRVPYLWDLSRFLWIFMRILLQVCLKGTNGISILESRNGFTGIMVAVHGLYR